ncbi:MAG TPA: GNAT family N-acetyltransferase [Chitinolyticbacter sp.]|nr:GNAT family N-acetyltransferase [Chitinolyticbacter sp.]
MTTIRIATLDDLDALAVLFDQYRQFYSREPDLARARAFLALRMEHKDSRLFVAEVEGRLLGFAQAYPSLSSLAMCPIWVLNDIYVQSDLRGGRIGTELLQAVEVAARAAGVNQIRVETAPENVRAQRLYQNHGFRREMGFLQFVLKV